MTDMSSQAAPTEQRIWRGMSRAELDVAYDNMAAVGQSTAMLADWTRRSAALRARQPELTGLRYGPRERNLVDVFRCGEEGAPLLVFIHGGYWQRNSKDVFSCMAEGVLPSGVDVAVVGYTLAPDAGLDEICEEIAVALGWLRAEGPAFGVATGRLIVSGWSAGGHLAARAMALAEVDAGLAVSGIFDLEPIRLGVLNDKIGLTERNAFALSPIHNVPQTDGRLVIAFGEAELPELQLQSTSFAAAWRRAGREGKALPLAGRNHFSILEELATPGGQLAREVLALAYA